ncbi:circularly permutated Ras protein 1 [Pelomyxa schiedti]|nr:circularly permutated Ras protein 1 [Pelomyxa schiedti]
MSWLLDSVSQWWSSSGSTTASSASSASSGGSGSTPATSAAKTASSGGGLLSFAGKAYKHQESRKAADYDHLAKVVLCGDNGIGKSCFLVRFTENKFFHEGFVSTIGAAFRTRSVELDGHIFKLEMWDTTGQERYRAITPMYYRGAAGVVLGYDISSRESYDRAINQWVSELSRTGGDTSIVLCGFKSDLNSHRAVATEEAQAAAQERGFLFTECSAKTGENVERAMLLLVQQIAKKTLGIDLSYAAPVFDRRKAAVDSISDSLDEAEYFDDADLGTDLHSLSAKVPSTSSTPSKKHKVQKLDANVFRLKLGSLADPLPLVTGDPCTCKSCGVMFNHKSSLKTLPREEASQLFLEQEKRIGPAPPVAPSIHPRFQQKPSTPSEVSPPSESCRLWTCEFCGTHQEATIDASEIPESDSSEYLVTPVPTATASASSNIIFVIDTSGSMSVTTEVRTSQKIKGTAERLAKLSSETGGTPSTAFTGVTHVSRLQCLQIAVEQQMERVARESPDKKIGLISFSNDVTLIGDGKQSPVVVAGDTLNSWESLMTCGKDFKIGARIRESQRDLAKRLWELEESGATALGPALLLAICIAGETPGSSVVVCTDGISNCGLGSLEGNSSEFAAFYAECGEQALLRGVTVSVVSLIGTSCKLESLSQVTEKSGGTIQRVDPSGVANQLSALVCAPPVIAYGGFAMVLLHKSMQFRGEIDDEREQRLWLIKDLGNITTASECTFGYQFRPKEEVDVSALNEVPFQVQLLYTRPDGSVRLRVSTACVDTTEDRTAAEQTADLSVVGAHWSRNAAKLAKGGDYERAQLQNRAAQRMLKRAGAGTHTLEEFNSKADCVDAVARKAITKEADPVLNNFMRLDRDDEDAEAISVPGALFLQLGRRLPQPAAHDAVLARPRGDAHAAAVPVALALRRRLLLLLVLAAAAAAARGGPAAPDSVRGVDIHAADLALALAVAAAPDGAGAPPADVRRAAAAAFRLPAAVSFYLPAPASFHFAPAAGFSFATHGEYVYIFSWCGSGAHATSFTFATATSFAFTIATPPIDPGFAPVHPQLEAMMKSSSSTMITIAAAEGIFSNLPTRATIFLSGQQRSFTASGGVVSVSFAQPFPSTAKVFGWLFGYTTEAPFTTVHSSKILASPTGFTAAVEGNSEMCWIAFVTPVTAPALKEAVRFIQASPRGLSKQLVEKIEASLKEGTVNAKGDTGLTLLHTAAYAGNSEVVSYLVEKAAKIDPRDDLGITPLLAAISSGHFDVANLLIEKGARPWHRTKRGQTALHFLAKSFRSDSASSLLLRTLLVSKIDVNSQTDTGDTALMMACSVPDPYFDFISSLIFAEANPYIENNNGESPAMKAKASGNTQLIDALSSMCKGETASNSPNGKSTPNEQRIPLPASLSPPSTAVDLELVWRVFEKISPTASLFQSGRFRAHYTRQHIDFVTPYHTRPHVSVWSLSGTQSRIPTKRIAPTLKGFDVDLEREGLTFGTSLSWIATDTHSKKPKQLCPCYNRTGLDRKSLAYMSERKSMITPTSSPCEGDQNLRPRSPTKAVPILTPPQFSLPLLLPSPNLTVTRTKLIFGGSEPCDIDKEVTETFVVKNNGSAILVSFVIPSDDRYTLAIDPPQFAILKGKEVEFKAKLTVLCTTTIDAQFGMIAADHKTGFMSHRKTLSYSDATFCHSMGLRITTCLSTQLDYTDLVFEDSIGQGSFAAVWKGRWRYTPVAIKLLKNQNPTEEAFAEFKREVKVLTQLRHTHIVNFIGAVTIPSKLCIVTEYMALGNLSSVLHKNQDLAWVIKLKIAKDIALAMSFLHENHIVHRDLKPDNILMVSINRHCDITCKVSDFGTSRAVSSRGMTAASPVLTTTSVRQMTVLIGTPIYMAPEILSGTEDYGIETDVFSYGVLLWQIVTGYPPYIRMQDFYTFVMSGKREEIPAETQPEYAQLITDCWHQDPGKRPPFPAIEKFLEQLVQMQAL